MNFISYFLALSLYHSLSAPREMGLGIGFFKKAHELAEQIYSV